MPRLCKLAGTGNDLRRHGGRASGDARSCLEAARSARRRSRVGLRRRSRSLSARNVRSRSVAAPLVRYAALPRAESRRDGRDDGRSVCRVAQHAFAVRRGAHLVLQRSLAGRRLGRRRFHRLAEGRVLLPETLLANTATHAHRRRAERSRPASHERDRPTVRRLGRTANAEVARHRRRARSQSGARERPFAATPERRRDSGNLYRFGLRLSFRPAAARRGHGPVVRCRRRRPRRGLAFHPSACVRSHVAPHRKRLGGTRRRQHLSRYTSRRRVPGHRSSARRRLPAGRQLLPPRAGSRQGGDVPSAKQLGRRIPPDARSAEPRHRTHGPRNRRRSLGLRRMSLTITEPTDHLLTSAAARAAGSQNVDVARSAFYLTSRNEPLLAWLHTSKQASCVDHGVVICAPVGFEQLHANRSLRHLADAVARQGIPALRFDWHGTGDSAGSDADPDRRATWHQNVRDAVAWMRSKLGCRRISIVGLRMGAMLAVEALGPDECDNLVLWAPVTCGKSYMRQMQTIEQMTELRPRPAHAAAGDVEAAGFLVTEETGEQFKKLNLLQKQLSCLQALVVGPADKKLAERFAQFDVPVTTLSPPGYAEMMAEPHFSKVPEQTIRDIAQWLAERIRVPSAGTLEIDFARIGPTQALVSYENAAEPDVIRTLHERVLRIGPDQLFGVLVEPTGNVGDLPAVIVLNAGAANHVGPGRIYVELTRRLANAGFRALRLDVCGLGDSVCSNPAQENDPYPSTAFRDVQLAIRELRERFGVTRCVLVGLCSGAYAAFQSAAQLSDPTLVESVLINPLTFHWEAGMPFDASGAEKLMQDHCRMARATNGRKLWKFLRGQTDIGYVEAVKLLGRRLGNLVQKRDVASTARSQFPPEVVGHPADNNLAADLTRVATAKRKLALFLAENDPGQAVMAYHAPQETKQWLRSGDLHLETIPQGDHTFSRRAPRAELFRALTQYLLLRYAVGITP
ncbi:MAG: hypothetical protein C0483_25375 [Pirellula sp.]|nr:hypothetical protein [Pirellula sp.]